MKKHRVKLPVWFVIVLMFLMSALVSAVVADARMKHLIQSMADIETAYIQETGKYPDWFIEWQNTVYLQEHMEE